MKYEDHDGNEITKDQAYESLIQLLVDARQEVDHLRKQLGHLHQSHIQCIDDASERWHKLHDELREAKRQLNAQKRYIPKIKLIEEILKWYRSVQHLGNMIGVKEVKAFVDNTIVPIWEG
jgi:DNA repair exonuclease SbcCD ATPase subunit